MSIDLVVRSARRGDPADRCSEAEPIEDVVETTASAFPQRPGALDALLGPANGEVEPSDDAFSLRIQAPAGADGLPVVVFIPGGGFTSGTGMARWFDSPRLAARVVLVTVNYRIGALGHLGRSGTEVHDTQRGYRDLIAALGWVRARIGDFGGDPDRLVLAGDSAGAWYAFALAQDPALAGWFERLALVSLPWEPPLDGDALAERVAVFEAALGDAAVDLATVPIERVLDAQGAVQRSFTGRGMPFLPAAGGPIPADLHVAAAAARRLHVRDVLLISTAEEAAAFLLQAPDVAFPDEAVDAMLRARFVDHKAVDGWIAAKTPTATGKQRMIEAITLHQFRLWQLELAAELAAAGIGVELGSLALPSPMPGALSPHCFVLPFLFGDREAWRDAPFLIGLPDPVFVATRDAVQAWFLRFVDDGAVGVAEEWTVFDADGARRERPTETGLRARR